ncbi:MAG: hypothetical protein K6E78_02500 [Treponema sp.]|nr:hypothetical protein [Treponema sp.]
MKTQIRNKKIIFLILFLSLRLTLIYSIERNQIDYYGVFSSDADKNMVKMTDDLFFTQLSEMNLSIHDRRLITGNSGHSLTDIDFSEAEEKAMSFYVEIKRKGDALSKWTCTIFLKNNSTQNIASFNREYDSYYKILMDSKTSLKGIFQDLMKSSEALASNNQEEKDKISDSKNISYSSEEEIAKKNASLSGQKEENPSNSSSQQIKEKNLTPASQFQSSGITENISGTWQGEEFIDKIVILKGGRGFIILKNGASMNVSINQAVNEEGQTLFLVKQTSHSNASYFPEIPRAKALEEAVKASPIVYTLVLKNDCTLEGIKSTLIESPSGNEIISGNISVAWKKTN